MVHAQGARQFPMDHPRKKRLLAAWPCSSQDFVDRVVFSLQDSNAMAAPELQMMCGKEVQAIQDFYTPKNYWIQDVCFLNFMFCPMILASPWYCDKNTRAHFPTNLRFFRPWKMPWWQSCCLATRCWCVCKRCSDPKQICSWKEVVPQGCFKKVIYIYIYIYM